MTIALRMHSIYEAMLQRYLFGNDSKILVP
jgi:hypothetical protein